MLRSSSSMSSKSSSKSALHFTPRDYQLLGSLRLGPFDAGQLCRLSVTYEDAYTDRRFVARRLRKLRAAGVVQAFPQATAGPGGCYYKLSRLGYQLLCGPAAALPKASFFRATSPALERHTRAVADVIVATTAGAHAAGLRLAGQTGDNQLSLRLGERTKKPDYAFQLLGGETPRAFVDEVDMSTEPITATRQRETLENLVSFYEDYRAAVDEEFVVRVFFRGGERRIERFLEIAALHAAPRRHLFLACRLDDYLSTASPLTDLVFRDHDGRERRCYKPTPAERRRLGAGKVCAGDGALVASAA